MNDFTSWWKSGRRNLSRWSVGLMSCQRLSHDSQLHFTSHERLHPPTIQEDGKRLEKVSETHIQPKCSVTWAGGQLWGFFFLVIRVLCASQFEREAAETHPFLTDHQHAVELKPLLWKWGRWVDSCQTSGDFRKREEDFFLLMRNLDLCPHKPQTFRFKSFPC